MAIGFHAPRWMRLLLLLLLLQECSVLSWSTNYKVTISSAPFQVEFQ